MPDYANRITLANQQALIIPQLVLVEPTPRELDLTMTLEIASGQSPRIALAASRRREAYARWLGALVLWLPALRAGESYNHHDGRLQNIEGDVVEVSRSALNAGFGANNVAAGSPASSACIQTAMVKSKEPNFGARPAGTSK